MGSKAEYKVLELLGNKKTKSGDQVSEWQHPAIEEFKAKMKGWDWSQPFEFEMPEKGIASQIDDLLKDDGLPDKLPEIGKLILYDSSGLTDFIKGSFLEQYGLIVSGRARHILEQFNVGKHRFYRLTLSHKGMDHKNYYFFKCLTNSNAYIDIKNSDFYSQQGHFDQDSRRSITFTSIEEINEFRQLNSGRNLHIIAGRITLNENFPNYDYFTVAEFGVYSKFISQQLSESIKELTGIKMSGAYNISHRSLENIPDGS